MSTIIIVCLIVLASIVIAVFWEKLSNYFKTRREEKKGRYDCCRRNFKEITKKIKEFAGKFEKVVVNTTERSLVINAPKLKEPLIISFRDWLQFSSEGILISTGVYKEGKLYCYRYWSWRSEGIMEISV